jgi:uncharacterized protein (TIGR02145 family)
LNEVVGSERKINLDKSTKISELTNTITSLESNISVLNDNVSKLSSELQTFKTDSKTKQQELITKNAEISDLQLQIKTKTDSLNLLRAELEKQKPDPKPVVTNNNSGKVTQTGSFKSVKIGSQTWMSENLNVSTFRNGDPIPEAKSNEEWKRAGENKQPAWCYYENDPKNGVKYGKLYNWYAVNDSRGLAPTGWHISSDAEWKVLKDYLGLDEGIIMKSISGWNGYGCKKCDGGSSTFMANCSACKGTQKNSSVPLSGNGTNSSGFSGFPGGNRYDDGGFGQIGTHGYWWSSTEYDTKYAWYHRLNNIYCCEYRNRDRIKVEGFSVRCLRD